MVKIVVALFSLSILFGFNSAFAAGDDPVTPADKWSAKWGAPDAPYKAARKLVEDGQYADAIKALTALDRAKDPRVLNYLGFAHRKLGQLKPAFDYYEKALAIAPDFTLAREYLGEAYLQAGQPDKAKAELEKIEKLCGTDCEAYKDLEAAIAKHGKSS